MSSKSITKSQMPDQLPSQTQRQTGSHTQSLGSRLRVSMSRQRPWDLGSCRLILGLTSLIRPAFFHNALSLLFMTCRNPRRDDLLWRSFITKMTLNFTFQIIIDDALTNMDIPVLMHLNASQYFDISLSKIISLYSFRLTDKMS